MKPHKTVLRVDSATAGRMATNAIEYAQELEQQRDDLLKLLHNALTLVGRCEVRQQDAAEWMQWAIEAQPIIERCKTPKRGEK